MPKSGTKFNYEKKLWGSNEVGLNPGFLGATRLRYALKALRGITSGRILEIGCGGGTFTRAIKRYKPKAEVTGLDLSKQSIDVAQRMDGGVGYVRGGAHNLPFKAETFDAVVSFDVWEHLHQPGKALQEVARVLKKGGLVHFFVPVEGNKLSLYQLFPESIYKIKCKYSGHINAYTKKSFSKMLDQAGLEVKKSYYSSYSIFQMFDLAFFYILNVRGKNVAISVEGYLDKKQYSLFDRLLLYTKVLFGWVTYLEDVVFYPLPGGGIHITAVKRDIKEQ